GIRSDQCWAGVEAGSSEFVCRWCRWRIATVPASTRLEQAGSDSRHGRSKHAGRASAAIAVSRCPGGSFRAAPLGAEPGIVRAASRRSDSTLEAVMVARRLGSDRSIVLVLAATAGLVGCPLAQRTGLDGPVSARGGLRRQDP